MWGRIQSRSTLKHYRGTSVTRHGPPLKDHHKILGIVLLQGPRREVVFISEVSLYTGDEKDQVPPVEANRDRIAAILKLPGHVQG